MKNSVKKIVALFLMVSLAATISAKPGKSKGKGKGKGKDHTIVDQNDKDNVKIIIDDDDENWPGKGKKVPFGQRKKYKKGPPDHAPAWGYRKKKGHFKTWHFPGSDVYYREKDKQYIYLEKGEWRIGRELPDWININYDNSITFENADQRLKQIMKKIGLD